jgi:hypothetical protein
MVTSRQVFPLTATIYRDLAFSSAIVIPRISLLAAATGGDPATFILTSPHLYSATPAAAATGEDPAASNPKISSLPVPQEAATGGDPASSALHSPLAPTYCFPPFPTFDPGETLEIISEIWPAFGDLRSAASAARLGRFRLAVGALLSEARVTFCSELLLACGLATLRPLHATPAATIHSWARFLLIRGAPLLCSQWSWSAGQFSILEADLARLVSSVPWAPCAATHTVHFASLTSPQIPFPNVFCPFFHAIRAGCP